MIVTNRTSLLLFWTHLPENREQQETITAHYKTVSGFKTSLSPSKRSYAFLLAKLISFMDDGNIVISSLLEACEFDALQIDSAASIRVTEGMRKYLAQHRALLR